MREEPLAGFVSTVVRVGDEVRRQTGPALPAVHALLRHLERVGFDGAPRFLGIDQRGRERLSYAEGETFVRVTRANLPDRVLPHIGRFIRRYHDAAAGFELPDGPAWHAEAEGDVPGEHVVCHNDISPRNIVFRDGVPVALIDWDLAYPAPRVWDVAHAVWQCIPLLDEGHYRPEEWSGVIPSREERLRRLRLLVDGYGLTQEQRVGFADVLALRIQRTADGIAALAAESHPVLRQAVADGVLDELACSTAWVLAHQDAIQHALMGID